MNIQEEDFLLVDEISGDICKQLCLLQAETTRLHLDGMIWHLDSEVGFENVRYHFRTMAAFIKDALSILDSMEHLFPNFQVNKSCYGECDYGETKENRGWTP